MKRGSPDSITGNAAGDKKLVAYCGLYCGDCFIGRQEIASLAGELLDKLKEAGFENCEKLDFLKPVNNDAHLKNLRKINNKGIDSFLSGKKYW